MSFHSPRSFTRLSPLRGSPRGSPRGSFVLTSESRRFAAQHSGQRIKAEKQQGDPKYGKGAWNQAKINSAVLPCVNFALVFNFAVEVQLCTPVTWKMHSFSANQSRVDIITMIIACLGVQLEKRSAIAAAEWKSEGSPCRVGNHLAATIAPRCLLFRFVFTNWIPRIGSNDLAI